MSDDESTVWPITKLKTSIVRDDGTLVLFGDVVCYTIPIAKT